MLSGQIKTIGSPLAKKIAVSGQLSGCVLGPYQHHSRRDVSFSLSVLSVSAVNKIRKESA
jgi:hypothetical protein